MSKSKDIRLREDHDLITIHDQIRIGDKILAISEHKEEMDQLISLCQKASISLENLCLRSFPFTPSFIEQNEKILDWNYLSMNKNLAWSEDLIERYHERWDWEKLSLNPSLPWSFKLIKRYTDRWCWHDLLGCNEGIDWSEELVDKLELGEKIIEFEAYHLPISTKMIERYERKWDWEKLSEKADLDWSIPFLRRYRQYWNWEKVVKSVELSLLRKVMIEFLEDLNKSKRELKKKQETSFGFSHDWEFTIKKSKDEFEIFELFSNRIYPWKPKMRELDPPSILFIYFSNSTALPWTLEMLRSFKENWDWERLSLNPSIPWSIDLIKEFEHHICWKRLSLNTGIPWNIELVETFKKNWYWEYLSYNPSWPLTIEFYERFQDDFIEERLFWTKRRPIAENVFTYSEFSEFCNAEPHNLDLILGHYPIEREFLNKYHEILDWVQVSGNTKLSWSKELIYEYEEKIEWKSIIGRNSVEWDVQLLEKYLEKIKNGDLSVGLLRKRITEIFLKIANDHFVKAILRRGTYS